MDFELTDDQLELQRSVRDLLAAECPPELPRRVTETGEGAADFWATQISLDWPGLALPEDVGGIGYGWVELAIVLEESGRVAAPGPFLATVTQFAALVAEAGSDEQRSEWLGRVARGEVTGTIAVDEGAGSWDVDQVRARARREGDDIVVSGTKRFVVDGGDADEVAVAVLLDDELRVVVVPTAAAAIDRFAPIDATLPVADLTFDEVRVNADRLLGDGDATAAVRRAVEEATVAVALVTVGACQRIFELILEYAKERHQFDVPIGSFQAVKHKLADMYRDVERARAVTFYAALCLAEDDPGRDFATAMAKAAAGECQQRAVQDGLQLFGGIGFTWEHDLHLFLRRAKVGELLLGSAGRHRKAVARMALAGALD